MADDIPDIEMPDLGPDPTAGGGGPAKGGGKMLRLAIIAAMVLGVVAIASIGGALAAKAVFGGGEKPQPTSAQAEQSSQAEEPAASTKGEEVAYVEFEPVVVNLNEQRLARYVRIGLKLKVVKKDMSAVKELVEKNHPALRSWLILYVSGKQLDDLRGTKSLERLLREIHEAFNTQLWPNKRGLIQEVLFTDMQIQ